jgi:imidazolonepropionase-like amidohydrolase
MNKMVRLTGFVWLAGVFLSVPFPLALAESLVLEHGVIHPVTAPTLTNGCIWIQDGRIRRVFPAGTRQELPRGTQRIPLQGQHVYPGLIALGTTLGITEIESVRATRDAIEVGEYTPDVQSWVAVNSDSELIPVARANGIAVFESAPKGSVVAGQSGLLATRGWTFEEMLIQAPAALHVYWPSFELNTQPREKPSEGARGKGLEEQAAERRAKVRALEEFFQDARAYAQGTPTSSNRVPAWDAMLPYVRAERPVVIHADEVRQIRSAVSWAGTNQIRIILAGGRDAWKVAGLLASNNVPVVYESIFVQPTRDTESYDQLFRAPEQLRQAGVKVAFGLGSGGFSSTSLRNLPYAAAQAIAFGLPEADGLRALTLHPAEMLGVTNHLGSLEPGKDATFFICDGNLFDVRSNVKRMWIEGQEVSLENRHTRLHDRFRNRPRL